jgi:hypothetical protein
MRLCPAHPGNPRRYIEGESPHLRRTYSLATFTPSEDVRVYTARLCLIAPHAAATTPGGAARQRRVKLVDHGEHAAPIELSGVKRHQQGAPRIATI